MAGEQPTFIGEPLTPKECIENYNNPDSSFDYIAQADSALQEMEETIAKQIVSMDGYEDLYSALHYDWTGDGQIDSKEIQMKDIITTLSVLRQSIMGNSQMQVTLPSNRAQEKAQHLLLQNPQLVLMLESYSILELDLRKKKSVGDTAEGELLTCIKDLAEN